MVELSQLERIREALVNGQKPRTEDVRGLAIHSKRRKINPHPKDRFSLEPRSASVRKTGNLQLRHKA